MDITNIRAALHNDEATVRAQRQGLRRELEELFAAGADVATDDEHDPEGATIAYERSRLMASIEQVDVHLVEIALALDRLWCGSYGTCTRCGGLIGIERLEARPIVRTCISCAGR